MQRQDVRVQEGHVVDEEVPEAQEVTPLVVGREEEQGDQQRDGDHASVHQHVEQRLVPGVLEALIDVVVNLAAFGEAGRRRRCRRRTRWVARSGEKGGGGSARSVACPTHG